MRTADWIWMFVGAVAGMAHALLLWQSVKHLSHGMLWHLARGLLIAGLLTLAVVSRQFLPLAGGWALAYFSTVGSIWRWRTV